MKEGNVVRTQPVAKSPRDFVDEWIASPWEEASKWCEKQNCEEFKVEHQQLYKIRSRNFGKVTRLQSLDRLIRVELWTNSGSNAESFWTFVVRQTDNQFLVMRVRHREK